MTMFALHHHFALVKLVHGPCNDSKEGVPPAPHTAHHFCQRLWGPHACLVAPPPGPEAEIAGSGSGKSCVEQWCTSHMKCIKAKAERFRLGDGASLSPEGREYSAMGSKPGARETAQGDGDTSGGGVPKHGLQCCGRCDGVIVTARGRVLELTRWGKQRDGKRATGATVLL